MFFVFIYIYIYMYIYIYRSIYGSGCHKTRPVWKLVTRGRWDPDRGSNGACPGLDLHAMAFLASAWGLRTAGMPRRLQELKTPEVAFVYLWGFLVVSEVDYFRRSRRVQLAAASSETMNSSCGPHASRTSFGARLPLRRCGS